MELAEKYPYIKIMIAKKYIGFQKVIPFLEYHIQDFKSKYYSKPSEISDEEFESLMDGINKQGYIGQSLILYSKITEDEKHLLVSKISPNYGSDLLILETLIGRSLSSDEISDIFSRYFEKLKEFPHLVYCDYMRSFGQDIEILQKHSGLPILIEIAKMLVTNENSSLYTLLKWHEIAGIEISEKDLETFLEIKGLIPMIIEEEKPIS